VNAVIAPTTEHRHFEGRGPRGHLGFSWARFNLQKCITYRLFRRDTNGKLYAVEHSFDFHAPRAGIAAVVWRMRIELRDRVDAIVLEQLGVTGG
jgi:hypothetical protein